LLAVEVLTWIGHAKTQRLNGVMETVVLMDYNILTMNSRDRLAFNKNILRKYIRECAIKESYIGAPWMVKVRTILGYAFVDATKTCRPSDSLFCYLCCFLDNQSSLCKKYDVETKLPSDLNEARILAISKINKRKVTKQDIKKKGLMQRIVKIR